MFVVPARASAVQQSRAAFEAMSTVPFAAMVCLRQGLRDNHRARPRHWQATHAPSLGVGPGARPGAVG
jgi:hypothetical protein